MAILDVQLPQVSPRVSRRLTGLLKPYLRDYSFLSAAELALRWVEDQTFWAPSTWLDGLLLRGDRVQLVTRAVAILMHDEEQERVSRRPQVERRHASRGRQGHRIPVPSWGR